MCSAPPWASQPGRLSPEALCHTSTLAQAGHLSSWSGLLPLPRLLSAQLCSAASGPQALPPGTGPWSCPAARLPAQCGRVWVPRSSATARLVARQALPCRAAYHLQSRSSRPSLLSHAPTGRHRCPASAESQGRGSPRDATSRTSGPARSGRQVPGPGPRVARVPVTPSRPAAQGWAG